MSQLYTYTVLHLPNAIFALIRPDQHRALIPALVADQTPLVCKSIASDGLYILNPVGLQDDDFLVCEKGSDAIPVTGSEKVIVCFDHRDEKYFMQASIRPGQPEQWKIETDNDIFKLQRRQSFRITIPVTYKSKAIFKDPKTEKEICSGTLIDISSGGCKVVVQGSSTLIDQQEPLIEISIGRRDPIILACEIRHVGKVTQPRPQDSLGVMFKTVNSMLEAKLFAITMELHRELTGKVGAP